MEALHIEEDIYRQIAINDFNINKLRKYFK